MDKKRQKEVKYETLQEEALHREIDKDDVLQEQIRQLTQDTITIISTVESQLMDSTQRVKFNIDKCIQNQTKIIDNIEEILAYQIELPKTYEKFDFITVHRFYSTLTGHVSKSQYLNKDVLQINNEEIMLEK